MKNILIILTALFLMQSLAAQHLYLKPKPLKKKADLEKIIGPLEETKPSRKLNILWVYGYDKHHIPGAHYYVKVKDLMVGLLKKVPDITVNEVFHFPDKEQFDKADLIVMYLHLPKLNSEKFANLENFVKLKLIPARST